jgi:hypothetical protein
MFILQNQLGNTLGTVCQEYNHLDFQILKIDLSTKLFVTVTQAVRF